MLDFRTLALAAFFALGTGSAFAASEWVDYTPEAFTAAQESGETILVDVTADWCPTCRAQKPILDELSADESLEEVVFVRVNFDAQKDFLQAHNVPRQSTILIFDGDAEVGRSIAETDRERLRRFVFEAVGN